jgi:hypothetical protein
VFSARYEATTPRIRSPTVSFSPDRPFVRLSRAVTLEGDGLGVFRRPSSRDRSYRGRCPVGTATRRHAIGCIPRPPCANATPTASRASPVNHVSRPSREISLALLAHRYASRELTPSAHPLDRPRVAPQQLGGLRCRKPRRRSCGPRSVTAQPGLEARFAHEQLTTDTAARTAAGPHVDRPIADGAGVGGRPRQRADTAARTSQRPTLIA